MADGFGLYLVMTDPSAGYEACAAAAVRCGVRYLQLRMKGTPRDAVLETALRVREITLGSDTLFIVNDDVTIARDVDADGVHLGQRDMPVDEARRLWPAPGKRFGLSTHNEQEALIASRLSPDYIGVGPVFATPTKAVPDPVLGLERMASIIRSSPVASVALGGIDCGNLAEVLRRGARNFCVVRAVNRRPDPETAILELQGIWRFESPRERQLLHPFDVSLNVPSTESPLVSALEPFQVPAPRHVVHDVGTEIEEDREVARLEDALVAPEDHWALHGDRTTSRSKIT